MLVLVLFLLVALVFVHNVEAHLLDHRRHARLENAFVLFTVVALLHQRKRGGLSAATLGSQRPLVVAVHGHERAHDGTRGGLRGVGIATHEFLGKLLLECVLEEAIAHGGRHGVRRRRRRAACCSRDRAATLLENDRFAHNLNALRVFGVVALVARQGTVHVRRASEYEARTRFGDVGLGWDEGEQGGRGYEGCREGTGSD